MKGDCIGSWIWVFCATWLLVKTLKIWSSESGANPWHSLMLAITPATKVPWPNPEERKWDRQIKEWSMLVIWTIHLGWFSQLHSECNNDWLNVFKPVSWHCFVSPSSSVFSLVQLVLSLTFLKWGCFSLSPVSNTATFTPEPANEHKQEQASSQTWSPKVVEN